MKQQDCAASHTPTGAPCTEDSSRLGAKSRPGQDTTNNMLQNIAARLLL